MRRACVAAALAAAGRRVVLRDSGRPLTYEELYPGDDGTVAGNRTAVTVPQCAAPEAPLIGGTSSPTAIHGDELLDELVDALTKYVVFPSTHAVHATALWIAATHGQTAWQHATRYVLKSPEKRCAKSKVLDLIEATCSRPLVTVNASVAAIFRSIDIDNPPTLIVDEADTIFGKRSSDTSEDLRGLLNAGFGRGRPALRCVGPSQTPTQFATFAMVALAAIGDAIPDTVTDRAVVISMRRRAPSEHVLPYRHRRDAVPLRELGTRLARWIGAHVGELEVAEPSLPVEDRAADLWEPLCAVADLAGGAWPARARAAAVLFTQEADGAAVEDSLQQKLLSDLRDILVGIDGPAVSSARLVEGLRSIDESPWLKFDMTANDLARRLKPYGVRPLHVYPDGREKGQVRGYKCVEFEDAFARYLKPGVPVHGEASPRVSSSPVQADT